MVDRARATWSCIMVGALGMTAHCGDSGANPCSMMVNSSAIRCPDLTYVTVAPAQAEVGGTVAVAALATGEVDAGTTSFSWSAPSGRFADPSSPVTTFTCTAVGKITLTVTAKQEGCTETNPMPVTVNCLAAEGGTPM
jgi:hypothetical protein